MATSSDPMAEAIADEASATWVAKLGPVDFVHASDERVATLARFAQGLFNCGMPPALVCRHTLPRRCR